jgi:hypothetical protein
MGRADMTRMRVRPSRIVKVMCSRRPGDARDTNVASEAIKTKAGQHATMLEADMNHPGESSHAS